MGLLRLQDTLSNPKHPFGTCPYGNLLSLKDELLGKGLDVHQTVMKFHETYYSANLMNLVVLGREPLEQLEQMVIEKFAALENKDTKPPDFEEMLYTDEEFQVYLLITTFNFRSR